MSAIRPQIYTMEELSAFDNQAAKTESDLAPVQQVYSFNELHHLNNLLPHH